MSLLQSLHHDLINDIRVLNKRFARFCFQLIKPLEGPGVAQYAAVSKPAARQINS